MGRHLGLFAGFAFAAVVTACGSNSEEAGAGGGESPNGESSIIGADGVPVGPDGKALPSKLDGQYEMSTGVDLTTAGVLPSSVASTLGALAKFKEKPAQAIVDLMDVANVPAADILNAIPGPVRPLVLGYIDEYVFKTIYDGVPIAKRLTGLLDDIGTIATTFQLVTKLDLPGGDAFGNAKAKHGITGVAYQWDAKRHVLEVPADLLSKFPAQPVEVNAVPLAPRSKTLELGRLQIGEHAFTAPIGSFTVRAFDALATDRFGTDLRGALGKVLDCDKLADAVSKRCIDPFGPGKICVDHKTEIKKICTTGLDLLVGTLKATIKGLDLSIHMKVGVAQMWDAPVPNGALDATADRLDVGFWDASLDTANGQKPILATFTGRRIGAPASGKDPVK